MIGDDSMQSACLIIEENTGEEFVWSGSLCQKSTEIQVTFKLPIEMTNVLTENEEAFSAASEDDCTICGDEKIGDPILTYNECSFICQRTD